MERAKACTCLLFVYLSFFVLKDPKMEMHFLPPNFSQKPNLSPSLSLPLSVYTGVNCQEMTPPVSDRAVIFELDEQIISDSQTSEDILHGIIR